MAELRPYTPTWRDTVASWMMGQGQSSPERRAFVGGLLGSTGLGNTGVGVVDATPVGGLLSLQEASQAGDKTGMALASAGLIPGAGVAEKVAAKVAERSAPAAERFITAYHGSPHSFDKFSLDKIGTGEGAQAFGHGLYFADNEAVAREYRGSPELRYERLSGHMAPVEEAVYDKLSSGADSHDTFNRLKKLGYSDEQLFDAIDKINPNKGSMYQVKINADPEHFLDWNKPLSEQSQHVQQALTPQGLGLTQGGPDGPWNGRIGWADDTGMPLGPVTTGDNRPANVFSDGDIGASIYRNIGRDSANISAEKLRKAGIPGIKYLDQGSRSEGVGSHNYVVFDDSLIDILKKYGLVGLLGGGAAMGASQQQQQGVPSL